MNSWSSGTNFFMSSPSISAALSSFNFFQRAWSKTKPHESLDGHVELKLSKGSQIQFQFHRLCFCLLFLGRVPSSLKKPSSTGLGLGFLGVDASNEKDSDKAFPKEELPPALPGVAFRSNTLATDSTQKTEEEDLNSSQKK